MTAAARLALLTLLAGFTFHAPANALSPLPTERATVAQKRCAAAERRVLRHREGVAQHEARLARDEAGRDACKKPRQCARLDREIRSEEARRKRIARQLAQFEDEAKRICSAAR